MPTDSKKEDKNMERQLVAELRMMVMIVMKKMNIHALIVNNEPSSLTLDAGNELMSEEDQWKDCLFLKVRVEKHKFFQIYIFDRLAKQESVVKR